MSADYLTTPIDESSREALAQRGLRMALVETADPDAYASWLRAESRGFYEDEPTAETLEARTRSLGRRVTGVWDDRDAEPETPVATVDSWPTRLTVPGGSVARERSGVPVGGPAPGAPIDAPAGGEVLAWAISGVTVAATHRRRGIARALLEAELRTAHSLGVPVAILTVSEATIYGRFGFSPSVLAAEWTIDTDRVSWAGRSTPGTVHFVGREQLRAQAPGIYDLARRRSAGEIEGWALLWDRVLGYTGERPEKARKLRCVRYDDEAGAPQGFAVYRVTEDATDFTKHSVAVDYLVAATDDAYAALWRFLLELDLVSRVTAPVRSVEEPFLWQLTDYRAAQKTAESDHLWLRILDVAGALQARRFSAPGRFLLDLEDPLGFAGGRYLLEIASDGVGTVTRAAQDRADDPARGGAGDRILPLSMTVRELSSVFLGGVRSLDLVRAGRIHEGAEGAAAAFDTALRSAQAPWESFWF